MLLGNVQLSQVRVRPQEMDDGSFLNLSIWGELSPDVLV